MCAFRYRLPWQAVITEVLCACVMTLLVAYIEQHFMSISYTTMATGFLILMALRIRRLRRRLRS